MHFYHSTDDNSGALAIVGRIMIRRTDESLRTEKRNESGNVSMVDALTFRHHVQLHQTNHRTTELNQI